MWHAADPLISNQPLLSPRAEGLPEDRRAARFRPARIPAVARFPQEAHRHTLERRHKPHRNSRWLPKMASGISLKRLWMT